LTIKAYLAAFGSENVHALYRDWRGIIMAIDKLLHHYPYDEKMVGVFAVVAVPGIRGASSVGRRHRQGAGSSLTGGCPVVESVFMPPSAKASDPQ
jgi:hypothetical protein